MVFIDCYGSSAEISKNKNDSIKNTFVISNCHIEANALFFNVKLDYGTVEHTYLYCKPGYTDVLTLSFDMFAKKIMNIYNVRMDFIYHTNLLFSIFRFYSEEDPLVIVYNLEILASKVISYSL